MSHSGALWRKYLCFVHADMCITRRTLTSPTALSNLTVVLTGQMNYSAGARERYISTKPLHKVLKMDLSRQVLPAGTHTCVHQ